MRPGRWEGGTSKREEQRSPLYNVIGELVISTHLIFIQQSSYVIVARYVNTMYRKIDNQVTDRRKVFASP